MKSWKCLSLGALIVPAGWLAAVLALAQPAGAQLLPATVYDVNVLTDGHDTHPGDGICDTLINNPGPARFCSLRAAVEENEAKGGGGAIRLLAGTVVLSYGELAVNTNVFIFGRGTYATIIDAGQNRGFNIGGTASINVSMSGFDIKNAYGRDASHSGRGGGIAVVSTQANVSLYRMNFHDNGAEWAGAGVYNQGNLTVQECDFFRNALPKSSGEGVTGSGAAIYSNGTMQLFRSTFTGNIGTRGGAILNFGYMTMTNCTVSGNKVTARGGGIFNQFVPAPGPGSSQQSVITYSTITNNEVGILDDNGNPIDADKVHGGGIYNDGKLTMAASILAGNITKAPDVESRFSGDCWSGQDNLTPVMSTFSSSRDNIIGELNPATCNIKDPFDDHLFGDHVGYVPPQAKLDPKLLFLSFNGGSGETHEPMAGSPAITFAVKGPGTLFPCPSTDQRGGPRPIPDNQLTPPGCTIGAFQYQAASLLSMEAENALPTGAFAIAFDAGASNSRYVSAPTTAASQTAALNDAHKMTFTFFLEQYGTYKIRGTVKTPTGENNSFYVRVNGYPDAGYIWDLPVSNTAYTTDMVGSRGTGTEANPEVPELEFNFGRGLITVEVYLRETGAQLDKLELVPSPALYQQEMETSAITGAFMVGFDPVASAGKFVYAPTGVNFMTAPNPANSMKIVLNAPTAGIYLLKGNVQAKRDTHNSFWVKVDGLPSSAYLWDMTEENAYFGADYLSDRGTGNSANPQVDAVELNLTAGPHTIEVFAREEGTRLDKLGLELKATAEARIISRNKTYTSSSNESSSYPPAKAFDNNLTTRWSSQFSDNQWIKADLGALYDIDRVVLNWEAAYATEYEIQISNDNENWTSLFHKTGNTGGIDNIMVTGRGRYVRMYGIHRATTAGFSLLEFNIYGSAASGGTVNLALSHGGATSGNQDPTFTGDKAVDGNLTTRWSSAYNDDQWFYVDLGTKQQLSGVKLRWEAAYGKGYEIQLSEDAVTWTPVFSTAAGNGGLDDLSIAGRARYVKMRGVKRATTAGYSLYEFEVYGR